LAVTNSPNLNAMADFSHIPVLLTETLDLLNLREGMNVVDCTLGLGGHSSEILKRIGAKGKLMAFDQDADNLKRAEKLLKSKIEPRKSNLILIHSNFENLKSEIEKHKFGKPDAILFDLGLSSPHVDRAERGFSFQKEGPLDMRYDKRQKLTAETVVNTFTEKNLADIIFKYGEEGRSRLIAKTIVTARRKQYITTTLQLAEIIKSAIKGRPGFNPATQTFQALRIFVNRELEVLESALKQAVEVLKPKGRIAVISYHSLEDRIVKNTLRYYTQNCICPKELPVCQCNFKKKLYLLTKKPIIPSGIEVKSNPRARSAKLRVAERI
jgi:16S rRNA (cytosine1402-N4)-methyltransferase